MLKQCRIFFEPASPAQKIFSCHLDAALRVSINNDWAWSISKFKHNRTTLVPHSSESFINSCRERPTNGGHVLHPLPCSSQSAPTTSTDNRDPCVEHQIHTDAFPHSIKTKSQKNKDHSHMDGVARDMRNPKVPAPTSGSRE